MNRHACRRCEWQPAADGGSAKTQAEDHADDAGHPLCIACGTSLPTEQPQACLPCVHDARSRLAEITELWATLPTYLGHPKAPVMDASPGSKSDETPLPGGDVLSLLADGSDGRWAQGEAHNLDHLPSDAPSIAHELSRWEDDWRNARAEPASTQRATVAGAANYLTARMTWAGDHHPAFDEFTSDIRKLLSRLKTVTATDDRPETGAPCFDCGATLERRMGEETYTCPRCRRTYDPASYWLAVRAGYETEMQRRKDQA